MNKVEFMKGIHSLQDNYNQIFSKEKLDLFYEELKDMNSEIFLLNIKKIIKTSQFMPNVAQIRGETKSKQLNNFEQRDYSDVDFDELFANHIPDT